MQILSKHVGWRVSENKYALARDARGGYCNVRLDDDDYVLIRHITSRKGLTNERYMYVSFA